MTVAGAPGKPSSFDLSKGREMCLALAIAALGLVGAREIAGLIGDVSVGGVTSSTKTMSSIFHVTDAGTALHTWADAACSGIAVKSWLLWYIALEALFVVGYTVFAVGASARWRLKAVGLIAAVTIAHVVQLLFTMLATVGLPNGPNDSSCGGPVARYHEPVVVISLIVATAARWLLIVGLVVYIAYRLYTKKCDVDQLRLTTQALGLQRFQLIVVALLMALFLASGFPILEQGVDVERSWIIDVRSWRGLTSAGWAALALGALAIALRYLSSVQVAPPPDDPEFPTPPSWPRAFVASLMQSKVWLLVTLITVLAIWALGETALVRVYHQSVVCLAIVLIAIPVLSAALAVVRPIKRAIELDDDVRAHALPVGRALSLAVPVVFLISVCRSSFAPLLLLPDARVRSGCALLVSAALAAGLIWWVLSRRPPMLRGAAAHTRPWDVFDPQLVGVRKAHKIKHPAVSEVAQVPGLVMSILPSAIVAVACAAPLLLLPMRTSRLLGVVGTVGFCLLLLTSFYTVLRILSQLVDPPHVFRLLLLRRTPVVGIVLVICVLSTEFAKGTPLHAIRPPAPNSRADDRPTLDGAFATWADNPAPPALRCTMSVTTPDGRHLEVRPLVMVAAEGGGIRAAWWTVDVMTALTSTECGRKSIFLVSGVSGGAVGLGVMATVKNPYSQMAKMASQDALAAGTDGLLSRDLLASAFGLDVRAYDGPADDPFPDRAALMEYAWERQMPNLTAPFPSPPGASLVSWRTVFNGTSVANKCRVLVSDVKLIDTPVAECKAAGNEIPGAYDVFKAQPCNVGLRTSTASFLAARFPYVTPSGVIDECGTKTFKDQVIDGGYAENSGIDTVDAILQQLMPAVRSRNENSLRGATTSNSATLIVPVVMFLHNTVVASSGAKPVTPKPKPKPEVLVPLTNAGDGSTLGESETLLQRAAATASAWLPDSPPGWEATNLVAAVGGVLPQLTMTIAPQREPQIALPLGWAMSRGTEGTLDKALDGYLKCKADGSGACAQSKDFDDLLARWKAKLAFPPGS
jgi:hypothetical protein